MLNWIRKWRTRRSQPPRIELEPDGFATVSPAGDRYPIRWTNVAKVAAFKRDHFTTDEIVVVFKTSSAKSMQCRRRPECSFRSTSSRS
jgi:hypothetical protein